MNFRKEHHQMESEAQRLKALVDGSREKARIAIQELQSVVERLQQTRQLLGVVHMAEESGV